MKRVLVIGSGSYIARTFTKVAAGQLEMTGLPGQNQAWNETSFEGFDAVLLCAGLVHQRKTTPATTFDDINHRMALSIAQKAKSVGVSQFVFLSTMSVYGRSSGTITADTQPDPRPHDPYGMSKWAAEQDLQALQDQSFTLTILRPPMVYGPGCPGNFQGLITLAKLPFFPSLRNERSMIYVEDLGRLLCALIEQRRGGVFCPQNRQTVCTADMVRAIGQARGRTVRLLSLLNPAAQLLKRLHPAAQKLWGDYTYDSSLSEISGIEYQLTSLEESVRRSIIFSA